MDTLAESYQIRSAEAAGVAAENTEDRKACKYTVILPSYCFVPLALKTLGPINQDGLALFKRPGHRLAQISVDYRQTTFLFQCFSAVAFCSTFAVEICRNTCHGDMPCCCT